MGKKRVKDLQSLLSAREAADYLNISLSTLSIAEDKGMIQPYQTPGGHRRYSITMLNEYLESTKEK